MALRLAEGEPLLRTDEALLRRRGNDGAPVGPPNRAHQHPQRGSTQSGGADMTAHGVACGVAAAGWCVLAGWPAQVARAKGYRPAGWFVFGLICFPLALVLAYAIFDRVFHQRWLRETAECGRTRVRAEREGCAARAVQDGPWASQSRVAQHVRTTARAVSSADDLRI